MGEGIPEEEHVIFCRMWGNEQVWECVMYRWKMVGKIGCAGNGVVS